MNGDGGTRFVLVAGTTRTAEIEGLSAAGEDSDVFAHTPPADAELVRYGGLVRAPAVPESPTGCLTPAVVTRAIVDLLNLDVTVVDGGLAAPSGAPTVSVGARPGSDIREQDPVSSAPGAFEAARQFGRALPADEIVIGESIPGGTTTALGVLRALGERGAVSSSLPTNPIEQKRAVVAEGLRASALSPGDAADQPKRAVRRMGDPVLAVAAGIAVGAIETDRAVTLAGGTQMATVGALLRHAGIEGPISLATTAYVDRDPSAAVRELATDLALDLTVTDPGFDEGDHVVMERFEAGEAKEGVGMGGALALAERAGLDLGRVRDRVATVADEVTSRDGSADGYPTGV